MRRVVTGLLTVLAIGACSEAPPRQYGLEENVCGVNGGKWTRVCGEKDYRCLSPYADAGKACSDSSDCEGECVADIVELGPGTEPIFVEPGMKVVGKCQLYDDPCGNRIFVDDGIAMPAVKRN
jgi:hypothetical protein